ncbi:MAG TPA: hypothetical protein PK605_01430 [Ignavibacteria bacterium]|nr:hypothetical protein [Bacteroidota bacterium]HRE11775.1 hypothetical protein [Ignavibacteria bacterium]HRF67344.1 hypothetical protein [Ignavibacteria bacterium]HRJ03042.1 hypothetical protein [Ignavibacteria bacterium]
MNDLFINTTWFFVLAAMFYFVIFIYALLKISTPVRNAAMSIRLNVSKQSFYITISGSIQKHITIPLGTAFKKVAGYLGSSGKSISVSELNITRIIRPMIIEPVNIVSLVFRKLYNESQTAFIGISTGLVVVFYIILSIF